MNKDQAKKIYSVTPELRDTILKDFSDEQLGIKPAYAKKWEELEVGRDAYYINHDSTILSSPLKLEDNYKNSLPTKEKAESVLAYCQLNMVYHQYHKGEIEYYTNIHTLELIRSLRVYYPFLNQDSRIDVDYKNYLCNANYNANHDFVFYNKGLCYEFIDNNRELLLTWFKGR